MNFNGGEVVELKPAQWDGKTRSMVVWNTQDELPAVGEVYGVFSEGGRPVWCARILGKEFRVSHVAEIPTVEERTCERIVYLKNKLQATENSMHRVECELLDAKKKNLDLQTQMNQYYTIRQAINKKLPCNSNYIEAWVRHKYPWPCTWKIEGDLVHIRFEPYNYAPKTGWDLWLENNIGMAPVKRRYDSTMKEEFLGGRETK